MLPGTARRAADLQLVQAVLQVLAAKVFSMAWKQPQRALLGSFQGGNLFKMQTKTPSSVVIRGDRAIRLPWDPYMHTHAPMPMRQCTNQQP